ncbi:MAG TPA: BlaI/MecI/CopY family transcriptional regulator [Thermoplasmata archaeon]|nr:BlaI/MecI/CopY family transcriptional regulator [Thermoplasmata archaeon]
MAASRGLGGLESDVLRTLGELEEAPAAAVRQRLRGRGRQLAYTTVATTLSRLWDKGFVHRRRETCRGGERYVYRSVNFERRYLQQVLRGVVRLFGPSGVVHLNEELAKLDPAQERALRRRLRL